MINLAVALVVVSLAVGLTVIVMKKWPRQGRMGINLNTVFCPECGDKMPAVRKPLNMRQTMWGGWTCPVCACEMDKYGALLVPGAKSSKQGTRL